MRIIAGQFRGRRLARVVEGIRPTSDRLRETLFNILGEEVVGSVCLDLFAGTGAVGIEAVSRGARLAILNDKQSRAAALIRRNLERVGWDERFQVLQMEALACLRTIEGRSIDWVYLDPPYGYRYYVRLLARLAEHPSLAEGARVVLECFKKVDPLPLPAPFEEERRLQQGDALLLFLRRKN